MTSTTPSSIKDSEKEFKSLSITYQAEMLSRLIITLALIFLFDIQSSVVIAVGILISFGFGLVPFKFKNLNFKKTIAIEASQAKQVKSFFVITAFYELTPLHFKD